MKNVVTHKIIISPEDVDKEIELVKQRITLKETELYEDFKVAPKHFFSFALQPLTSVVPSFIGEKFLLKTAGAAKNLITHSSNKNENKVEKNQSHTKAFILRSLKDIGWVSLLKLGFKIIRRI